jgi:hypothetical protein
MSWYRPTLAMRVRGREDLGAIGNEQASPDGPFGVAREYVCGEWRRGLWFPSSSPRGVMRENLIDFVPYISYGSYVVYFI